MADVFISYAREDRARAEQVAKGLEAASLNVFWDSEIPPGQTWADYIEGKLSVCKAVIVLWSANSTKSQWVREEARMGRDRGTLIPVMIDATPAPFGFGEVQAADLSSWNGEADNANWRRFIDAVTDIAKNPAPRPAPQPAMAHQSAAAPPPWQAPSAAKKKGVPTWVWIVGAVVLVLVLLGALGSMLPDQSQQQVAGTDPSQQIQSAMQTPPSTQPTAPAQPLTQADYQQQILARLSQVEQQFAAQGYRQIAAPVTGQLAQGQNQSWPASLEAGGDYRIIGVCDNDCGDLDLVLYDQNNTVVSQDQSTDATPVVAVAPQWTGPFTVQTHMFNCTVAPCYYAIVLYGRPLQ